MANTTPLLVSLWSTVQAGSTAIGSASATGITLATGDGAKLPTVGTNQYIPAFISRIVSGQEVGTEFVWVTAVSTDTLTVVRGAEQTGLFPSSTTSVQAGDTISFGPGTTFLSDAWAASGGDYFRSGYYALGVWNSAAYTTQTLTLNRLYVRPMIVPVRRTFDRIGVNVTSAATTGGIVRMGIYSDGGGVPGTLLLDAGTAASTTTGGKEITISQTLAPGTYWVAIAAQTAVCTVTALATTHQAPMFAYETTPLASAQGADWQTNTSVSGALPSTFTIASWGSGVPLTALRAA